MRYYLNLKTSFNQVVVGLHLVLAKKKVFAIYVTVPMAWNALRCVAKSVMHILVMYLMMARLQQEPDTA
jgi:hypothetical protein